MPLAAFYPTQSERGPGNNSSNNIPLANNKVIVVYGQAMGVKEYRVVWDYSVRDQSSTLVDYPTVIMSY